MSGSNEAFRPGERIDSVTDWSDDVVSIHNITKGMNIHMPSMGETFTVTDVDPKPDPSKPRPSEVRLTIERLTD